MISIIIPTYNEEKAIGDSLARLKPLSLSHEVIVTDDKSTDRTVEIARKHADLVLVPPAKHISISANRNDGAAHSKGEFLAFIDTQTRIKDPDDLFKRALAHFEADPNLVAVTGALWVLPESETRTDRLVYTIFNWISRFRNNVLRSGEASGKFQMMRREAFDKVNGFREDLITREDGDMFNRLSKVGKTLCDKDLSVFHSGRREHALGWPKLLWIWTVESLWFALFDKNIAKEWKAVR